MNEPIVQTTKFNEITDNKFLWQMYANTHLLANVESRAEEVSALLRFIERSKKPGTCVSVDSYLFGNFSIEVDCVYELESYQELWKDSSVNIIPSVWQLPNDQAYDNVIATGSHAFKYKTIPEYADDIRQLLKITRYNGGVLIVCFPKLHLQYHRLKFQPQDTMVELQKHTRAYITDSLELEQDFYLRIQNGQ